MAKFLSGRQKNLKLGISSYTENEVSLEVIGRVGIASAIPQGSLDVGGESNFRGSVSFGTTVNVSTGSTLNFDPNAGIYVAGVAGTIGQVLQSTGFGVTWASQDVHLVRSGISTIAGAGLQSLITPYTINSLDVFVNGILLDYSEYTANDGANISLNEPLSGGETVQIFTYHINDGTNPATNGPIILFSDFWNVGFNTTQPVGIFTDTNVGLYTNTPTSALDINGDVRVTGVITASSAIFDSTGSIQIPVGNTAERPGVAVTGQIRYNTDVSSFEGYGSGSAWGSLGGIKDVDGDTYIKAESSPGSDEDALSFFTSGTEKVSIIADGNLGINSTAPTSKLDVDGDVKVSGAVTASSFDGTNARISGILTANQIVTNTGGTPSITSPNNINLNANRVSISTDVTVGRDLRVEGNSFFVGVVTFAAGTDGNIVLGDTPTDNILANANLDVDGFTELDDLNVTGVATFTNNVLANANLDVDGFTELDDLNVTGVATFTNNVIFDNTGSIQIPVGTTAERLGVGVTGQIRYNTELSSFEGYGAGNAWGSLGGVKDVDQDTYIKAESSPGSDEDALTFFTAGTEKVSLIANGNLGIGSAIPSGKLDVLGQVNIKGSSTTTTSGIATSYTGSVQLDGNSDYLTVPGPGTLAASSNWTLECYFYCTGTTSGTYRIVGANESVNGSEYTFIRIRNGKYQFFTDNAYSNELGSATFNTWVHIAFTKTGTTLRGFVDGVKVYEATDNNSDTISTFVVGWGYGTEYFPGYISNVRFVNGTSLYKSNFTPQTAELTKIHNTTHLLAQSSSSATEEATGKTVTAVGTAAASTTNPSLVNGFDTSGSVYFDGNGDYLSIPSSSDLTFGTGDFTVEMWVYAENFTNRGTLYDSRPSGGTAGITIGHESSTGELKVYMNATSGSDQIVDSTDFAIGRWYHIAVTCESTSVRLFVNGVLKDTGTGRDLSNTNAVNIGYKTYTSSSYNYFNGFISNVRVIKGTALYTSNFSPTYTELTNLPNTKLLALQSSSSATAYAVSPGAITAYGDATESSTSPDLISPNSLTGSVAFDGNGDYLSTADNSDFDFGTGDFTVELFTNNNSAQSGNPVLIGANGGWYIQIKTGGTILEFYTGSTSITATGLNLEGAWHHIAVTKQSNSVRIFVDGVLQSTTANSDVTNLANTLYIGNYSGSSLHYLGYISNVRVIKGTALYTAAFTPSREELTNVTNTSLLACQSSSSATAEATGKTITAVGNAAASTTSPGLVKAYTSGSTTTTTTSPGNLLVSGITTATNRIDIKSDDSTPGRIDFYCESSNAHYTQLRSADHASYSGIATVTLPTSTGTLLLTTGTAALAEGLTGSPTIGVSTITTTGSVGIGSALPSAKLDVAGDAIFKSTGSIQIPVGDTSERPGIAVTGQIRYNTQNSSFEGYGPGGAWGSLGGVKDVDGDTYIKAESSAGSDEDALSFFTAGTEKVSILSNGNLGIGSLDPKSKLDIDGDARITGILTVGNSSITIDGDNNIVQVGTALTLGHTQGLQFNGQRLHTSGFEVDNINASGIVTATSFFGDSAYISGNVTIGGTLTYEDVNNVDSLGIITAREGINVLSNGITAVGIITATGFVGDGSNLTGLTGAAATTYGTNLRVPVITVDATGRITDIDTTPTNASSATTRNTSHVIAGAGQTTFNVNYTIGYIDIFLNGSKLDSTEFAATDGTTVILTDPAVANDVVEFVAYETIGVAEFDKTTRRVTSHQIAGAGQTAFSVTHVVGYVDVFLNGSKLDGTEFTSDGSQVVLIDPAVANDVIEFIAYESIGINAYDKQTRRSKSTVTAGAGQTSFNVVYTPSHENARYIDVYLNGSKLDSSEYIALDGGTVELNEGAVVNDLIEFVAFETVGIASVALALDDTPQLSANLNLNGQDIIGTGNLNITGDFSITGDSNIVGNSSVSGVTTSASFVGVGSLLTNLSAPNLEGSLPALDASALLNLTGVSANTYGSSTFIPRIIIDANGRISGIETVGFGTLPAPNLEGDLPAIDASSLLNVSAISSGTYGSFNVVPSFTFDTNGRITGITTHYTDAGSATRREVLRYVAGVGQTTFAATYTIGFADVFLNGSKLDSTEYIADDGESIVLTEPAIENDVVEIMAYRSIGIADFDKTTRRVKSKVIAGAGQTAFAVKYHVADDNGRYVDVYINGSKLDTSEYTATDGYNIYLTDGAVVNDVVELVAYESIGIADYDKQTRRAKSRVIAGAGQTSFNVAYTPSHENARYIDVYLNGSKLDTTEYIALDGGTVELIDGAIINDVVEFVAFETVGIASVALSLDDTPQLSADLDLNGQDIIGTGNLSITGSSTIGGDSNIGGNCNVSGINTSGSFVGIGSLLTNLSAPNLEGNLPAIDGSALLNLTGASENIHGSSTFIPRISVDANGRISGIETVGFGTLPAPNLEGDLPAIDGSALLNVSGISAGTYGAFNVVPSFTFDTKGRIVGITTHYTDAGAATRREVLRYVATQGQSTFAATYTIGFADVFLNGSKLDSTEYDASNGTSIVLTDPAVANDVVEIMAYRSIGIADFDKTTRRRKTNITAGAGQTVFNVDYHVSDDNGRYVDVYINGAKLDTSEYTATDGSTVILDDGAIINDVVELVAYESIGIADYDKQTVRSKNTVTAGAGQTTFDISYNESPVNGKYIDVYLNGSRLDTTEYIATNGSTVELVEGAIVNDAIEFVVYETVGISSVSLHLDDSPQLGGDLDGNSKNINNLGVVTATRFEGDGSALTGVIASGTAIQIQSAGTLVGISTTINFASGVSLSNGIASIAVNIADDTTPQLGATLDTNGNLIQFGDCNSPTNNRLQFGSSQDLEIYHDGLQSYIGADDLRIVNGSITETYAIFTNNGSVELYYDNNKKFETSGIGVTVTGNIEATGDISAANLIVSGNVSIAGTITYDDVTHVDSIGIVTARSGIDVLTGDVTPGTDNTQDLGSASKRWANIYTGDLQLSNKGSTNDVDGTWGQFTIQEGEDDLFLINRRNGKKYKFVLQEVN